LAAATETPAPAQLTATLTSTAGLTSTTEITGPAETQTPAPESLSGGPYPLVYTRWDGIQHNIYVADTNGQGEQLLVTRGAGPSWTPDGRYIFFYGEQGVDRQIRDGVEYVNPNYRVANGIVRLTTQPFPADVTQLDFYQGPGWNDGTARWAKVAPNGEMVAYDARPGGSWRVYFLGTSANQQYSFQLDGEQADWAPDSQKLAYRSGRGGSTGIWVSNRDESGTVQISDGSTDSFPAWSPDGQTIVFSRDEGGDVDLYAINPDGSNVRRLTDAPGPDTLPTFAPNGEIIFRSARTGNWSIWKMGPNGENQTQIIADAPVGQDWAYSRMDVLD
jgi:Tol biopolymer transport system component